jgi:uncharacterized cofD-like protein
VQALAEILDARGTILPVTVDDATLVAELTDGSRIFGEEAIDLPRGNQREKIRDVFLVPHHRDSISVYPPVLDAIENSDYIIIGPGDLYTSIFPNLIVQGVKEAIQKTKAQILYIVNIMTKFGETHNYKGADFIKALEDCIGRRLDGIIINTGQPEDDILGNYMEQKAALVIFDDTDEVWRDRNTYPSDLLDATGDIVRHDSKKLAMLITEIISK